ncbi:helix-turn-helix domain-containing protein [Actinocorallia populi]|uniref:helix-turn-helix domain-containing protein n=1 Tax=Actinocorallia populi TaxID=2079200 RepID=UPI001300422A|nr:helix-turn-helix transcriptional regulator [Actinocorallia populi]
MAPQRKDEPLWPQKMFALEMRARREAAGLSRNRLAEALGCTPQWLAKVETYDKTPSEALADDLDTYFKAGGAFHRLWEEIIDARKRGLMPSGFRRLIDAEKGTTGISFYEPMLIPGLFQTEEYARLMFSAGHRPDRIEELVAIRLERQAIFLKENPPWAFLLIREAVIRDLLPDVRLGQCKRLLDLMSLSKISIQIIPKSARVFHPTGFQVLNFDKDADVAYMEGSDGNGRLLTEPGVVRRLAVLFNVIRSDALPAEETENLIRTIMEDE